MKALLLMTLIFTACSSSTNRVKHTLIVKGSTSSTAFTSAAPLAPGDDPISLKVTVVELHAGEAADCSDITIIRRFGTSGKTFELIGSASSDLISARPPEDKAFQCIVVKITDEIVFTPNTQAVANHAACLAGTEYTFDAYVAGSTGQPFRDINGNDILGAGNPGATSKEFIYFFFSVTQPAFAKTQQWTQMTSPLNTAAPYDIFLYADFDGTVNDAGGNCYLSGESLKLR